MNEHIVTCCIKLRKMTYFIVGFTLNLILTNFNLQFHTVGGLEWVHLGCFKLKSNFLGRGEVLIYLILSWGYLLCFSKAGLASFCWGEVWFVLS